MTKERPLGRMTRSHPDAETGPSENESGAISTEGARVEVPELSEDSGQRRQPDESAATASRRPASTSTASSPPRNTTRSAHLLGRDPDPFLLDEIAGGIEEMKPAEKVT